MGTGADESPYLALGNLIGDPRTTLVSATYNGFFYTYVGLGPTGVMFIHAVKERLAQTETTIYDPATTNQKIRDGVEKARKLYQHIGGLI